MAGKFSTAQLELLKKSQEMQSLVLKQYRLVSSQHQEAMKNDKQCRIDFMNGENAIVASIQMLNTLIAKHEQ